MSKHDSNFKSKMIHTQIVISQSARKKDRKQMNKKNNKCYVYVNLQRERMQMGQKERGEKKIENTEQK